VQVLHEEATGAEVGSGQLIGQTLEGHQELGAGGWQQTTQLILKHTAR